MYHYITSVITGINKSLIFPCNSSSIRVLRRGCGQTAIYYAYILNGSSIIAKQSCYCSYITAFTVQPDYRKAVAVKCTSKCRTLFYSNRFPALTVVIKFSALSKVHLCKFNIRYHFKMRV